MHRMDSLDSSKSKTFFKKRSHRPWNATLLENTLEESSPYLEYDSNASELRLQHTLEEKTKEHDTIYEQLHIRAPNRLLIGGFLHPQNIFSQNDGMEINNSNHLINELKNKEQEILSLANDIKVSKALEQVEKLEISIKKEEEARKSAESKALFAIQEAKIAAEQTYRIEQQMRKEEKARKILEEKNQQILQEIEKKEQAILLAEEKTKKTLEEKFSLEKRIKIEAEDKIKKIANEMFEQIEKYKKFSEETAKQASEKISNSQTEANQKIKTAEINASEQIKIFQNQADEKVNHAQSVADKEIQEAQKKIQEIESKTDEQIKIFQNQADEKVNHAQSVADKEIQEAQKKIQEIESKTDVQIKIFQKQADEKVNRAQSVADKEIQEAQKKIESHEKSRISMQNWAQRSIDAVHQIEAAKKEIERKLVIATQKASEDQAIFETKIESLLEKIHQNEQQKAVIEHEKTVIEENLHQSTSTVKKMESIIKTEQDLRKVFEQKRKFLENKILELNKNFDNMEIEKRKVEQKISSTVENLNKLKILIESEKIAKALLEKQLKESVEKIYTLENLKQKENDAKQAVEHKVTLLLNQKEHLEQEKLQNDEKIKNLISHSKELEAMLESEKYLRKEADRLKFIEEQLEKNAHAETLENLNKLKILMESEKATRTLLDKQIKESMEKIYTLENLKQNEHNAKQAAEHKVTLLLNQKEHLEQEKLQNDEKIKNLINHSKELEATLESEKQLRKEAERLKFIEEQAKNAAQEKINHAIEQANKTALNLLGGLATVEVPNNET